VPAPTAAEPALPPPIPDPGPHWWHQIDRAAGACGAAAVILGILSLFPPTSAESATRFPGEIATGRFAAGQLPTLVLLVLAGALHLTRDGHRYRPLLYAVAAGTACYALVDSLRVYAFTQSDHGGAYDSALARTNASLPRASVALIVFLVAMAGVLKTAPRPKPRPGPHLLAAALLAAVAVVLAAVAVAIGPAIHLSRLHDLAYGVPLASSLAAALLLAAGALSRRVPVLEASITVSGCAFLAGAVAANRLHYPLGMIADCLLIGAAVIVLLATGRPAEIELPPPPPQPFWRPPYGWPPHVPESPLRQVVSSWRRSERKAKASRSVADPRSASLRSAESRSAPTAGGR
jgi:hypothetical protein